MLCHVLHLCSELSATSPRVQMVLPHCIHWGRVAVFVRLVLGRIRECCHLLHVGVVQMCAAMCVPLTHIASRACRCCYSLLWVVSCTWCCCTAPAAGLQVLHCLHTALLLLLHAALLAALLCLSSWLHAALPAALLYLLHAALPAALPADPVLGIADSYAPSSHPPSSTQISNSWNVPNPTPAAWSLATPRRMCHCPPWPLPPIPIPCPVPLVCSAMCLGGLVAGALWLVSCYACVWPLLVLMLSNASTARSHVTCTRSSRVRQCGGHQSAASTAWYCCTADGHRILC